MNLNFNQIHKKNSCEANELPNNLMIHQTLKEKDMIVS